LTRRYAVRTVPGASLGGHANVAPLVATGGLFTVATMFVGLAASGNSNMAVTAALLWAAGGICLVIARRPGNDWKLAGAFAACTVASGIVAMAVLFNVGLVVIACLALLLGLALLTGAYQH
jgi:hypothetical protein